MAEKKKRDWSRFELRILIKKSPARVYKAWTDGSEISKWFTVKSEFEPKKNGRIYFEWLAGDKMEAKVISASKNRFIVFPFGRKGEKVRVNFKKAGVHCVCELIQYDMKTDAISKWNMHRGCIQGWTFFLANLKSYLEHGIDLRSHDPKRSYRQDYVNS